MLDLLAILIFEMNNETQKVENNQWGTIVTPVDLHSCQAATDVNIWLLHLHHGISLKTNHYAGIIGIYLRPHSSK